ncbi:MAG: ABC transporter substrate-binding protein [Spirochaetaceae bacterium]|jgi:multiple sugar transport system substrate-binding protein|nr:ABC transporter substrate-binding protein [Spirochaetaceae bacterium]
MMKKILLSVMMILVMTGLVFAAGGQQQGAAQAVSVNEDGTVNNPEDVVVDPNKLVFWSLFAGGDGAWMDRIIADYNATGPTRQVQSVMLVWADYYTKFGTAVAARKGPDIGVSHISRLPELVEQGMVIAIDDYAAKAGVNWNEYTPAMIDGISFNGKKYAMPLDTHAEIMYVNVDKLKAAGVALNAANQITVNNAEEFKAILDQIKPTLGAGESALSLPQKGDDPYRAWWAVYFQMGGTPLLNAAGTQVTLNKDIAVKAMDYVKSLWTDGYVLPGIEDHQQFFQGGSAALTWGGTWATGVFTSTSGLNVGAQPFPSLFGTNQAQWADAHVFTIPAKQSRNAANTQAAVNFISWAATKGAATWAESGQIPSNIPVQSSPAFTALPRRGDYAKAAATAVLPSKDAHFGSLKDAMIKNLDLVWNNQASSTQAAQNIIDEFSSAIKN